MRQIAISCLLWLSLSLPSNSETIDLLYYERPPYFSTASQGKVSGLIADPTVEAFAFAKIDYRWVRLPRKRIELTIKENDTAACAIGVFKIPDREQFARFSVPIFIGKPAVAVARSDLDLPRRLSAGELQQRGLRVIIRNGLIYDPRLAPIVQDWSKSKVLETALEVPDILNVIKISHADLTFISIDELDYFVGKDAKIIQDLDVIALERLDDGAPRYLMCSKSVSQSAIDLFNGAIQKKLLNSTSSGSMRVR